MNDRTWATLKIFVKGSLITSFLWPTGSEWHCPFCERQSYHITPCGQQQVSDSAHFVKGSLITSLHMTNSEWVRLHILWKAVSSHLPLWPTASQWCGTFCERQSHLITSYDQQLVSDIATFVKGIFSYDQQGVSDIAGCVKGSLATSFPMTDRKWVTLHIFWKAVSSHMIFLWPTGSEVHILWKELSSYLFL